LKFAIQIVAYTGLLLFSVLPATAGKLTSCDDVEQYAKEIALDMLKGVPKDNRIHLYEPRYSVSNAIVSYVYSLKGIATPFRIGTLAYRRCQTGAYGSSLSDRGSYEPHYQIGNPVHSRAENSPDRSAENQAIIENLIKKMH